MISKKICLIGSFAVGKTSLTRRYVSGGFDEKYQTTIGVKINKKEITLDQRALSFVIWDLEGPDEFAELRTNYLRGAAGYLLVVDSTRPNTLKIARELHKKVVDHLGDKPFLLLVNKADLVAERNITSTDLQPYLDQGWHILETSAKTGHNVEAAFRALARLIMEATEAQHHE